MGLFYHVEEVIGRVVYVDHDPSEKERMVVRLFVSNGKGWMLIRDVFHPYVLVLSEDAPELEGEVEREVVKLKLGLEDKVFTRVRLKHPKYLQRAKEKMDKLGIPIFEHDLGAELQYFIEKGMTPTRTYRFTLEKGWLKSFEEVEDNVPLRRAAIDIEVYAPNRSPLPEKDPVIMVSYVDSDGLQAVLTTKKIDQPYVRTVESETKLIQELTRIIRERDPDVIYTYNGDDFDLPYLKARASVLGLKLPWGRDGTEVQVRRTAIGGAVSIRGRAHVDVFRIVDYMASIGAINTYKLDLESVYRALKGKEKVKIDHLKISDVWKNGDLSLLAEYNLQDAIACFEIGEEFLDLYVEIGRYTLSELYEAVRMSASQIVENKLIKEAKGRGKVVPRRPKEREVLKRLRETYTGGYVHEPSPGLYENIAVLDFRSLYPSIIITHNVDPELVNREICPPEERYVSPAGHFFCKEPKGLLPSMLEDVLTERFALKKKLKSMERGTPEYKLIYARQQALKIIANASYGYLGFARARWYCKECAEAITSWARSYIKWVMEEAEKWGFRVIYGDTDSVFLQYREREEVLKFLEYINNELPGMMELELDGFYVRGIFIKKRKGERAAKKKYALMDEKGNLKVTGMEYVRRDWSEIARETQLEVLRKVLAEGDVEGALEYVRKVIENLREGKAPLEKLVIYTEIQKELHEYEQTGPHVVAATKLKRAGYHVKPGTIVGYIIRKGAGSVSERAEPVELFKGEYDEEYYIERQVLPAVLPIFESLGYRETDLLKPRGQKTLFDFS